MASLVVGGAKKCKRTKINAWDLKGGSVGKQCQPHEPGDQGSDPQSM